MRTPSWQETSGRNRGRCGLALQRFDIRRDRDGLNVFEVLIPGALGPGQELLNRPVIGVWGATEQKTGLSTGCRQPLDRRDVNMGVFD